jgi:hypothetical protein
MRRRARGETLLLSVFEKETRWIKNRKKLYFWSVLFFARFSLTGKLRFSFLQKIHELKRENDNERDTNC